LFSLFPFLFLGATKELPIDFAFPVFFFGEYLDELPISFAPTVYFHVEGRIGIVHKIEFEIRPDFGCTDLKTSRKVVLDNPSVCLAVAFPRALTGVRVNRSS